MSLNSMARRLSLEVPGVADRYAITLINEALRLIQDDQLWSFQLKESGWLTPGLLFPQGTAGQSTGTVTVTVGSDVVTGSAAAAAAWAAYVAPPFLTQCQFRSPYYSLYNIISYNPLAGTLQLDRPWMEPGGTGRSYMIYQAYFAAPVADFNRFLAARDTTNNAPMNFWGLSQKDLSFMDPERTIFDMPRYIVPYQVDARVGSSTFGQMLFELWPHPLSRLPYTFAYLRSGDLLVNGSDTLPVALPEEAVLWRAKECAFLYKEAQKGEDVERGAGADFRYLAEAAHQEYKLRIEVASKQDDGLVNLYMDRFRRAYRGECYADGYATINGQLNVGHF